MIQQKWMKMQSAEASNHLQVPMKMHVYNDHFSNDGMLDVVVRLTTVIL